MFAMELPIAAESYRPTTDALVRAVKRAAVVLGRAAAEEVALDRATLFIDPRRPGVALCNFAAEVHLPGERSPRAVIDAVLAAYAERGAACLSLDSAELRWPDEMPQALSGLGYFPSTRRVMLLGGGGAALQGEAAGLQVVPARAAYGGLRAFFRAMAGEQDAAGDALAQQAAEARVDQLDEPRLEAFVGLMQGRVVGSCGVVNLGNIGVLHDLFTLPSHRGQGVGATLLRHTLDHCHRAQFEQVLACFPQNCPHGPLYEAAGFATLTTFIRYRRRGG